eukprot:14330130-Alexandrium_andersonii.AAC.1
MRYIRQLTLLYPSEPRCSGPGRSASYRTSDIICNRKPSSMETPQHNQQTLTQEPPGAQLQHSSGKIAPSHG